MDIEVTLPNQFEPRPYQARAMAHFDGGGRRGCYVWGRRTGKDVTFAHETCKMAHERIGTYYHMLPTFAHCKRAIWDMIDDQERRTIHTVFPPALRSGEPNEQELKIKLRNGSVWQMIGADNFNSVVGSNPVGIVFSEYALIDPRAWQFFRPILVQNKGWAAFIGTPRGYNHFFDQLQIAKREAGWHWSHVTAIEAGTMGAEDIRREIREGMPEELARQEYLVDFAAANVGAILGARIELAERQGRIRDEITWDPDGAGVVVSSDIGFSDSSAWWFWQPRPDGFALIHYEEDHGLDADDWIDRLRKLPYPIARLWLPHDAKSRTFATRHSAMARFIAAGYPVSIVPQSRIIDRVNAARVVIRNAHFNASACQRGLEMLRAWSFKYSEESKTFSREPDHNYASHCGDAFSYGALVLREDSPRPAPVPQTTPQGAHLVFTLDMLQRYSGPHEYIRS